MAKITLRKHVHVLNSKLGFGVLPMDTAGAYPFHLPLSMERTPRGQAN